MKKKSSLIIIIIILVVVIIGASVAYKQLTETNRAQNLISNGETVNNDAVDKDAQTDTDADTGDSESDTSDAEPSDDSSNSNNGNQPSTLPDFTVIDTAGNEIHLSDFVGKPVILNFWASWCGPCKAEMPDFDEMYAEYGDEIHFVMVNVTDGSQETIDSAKSFIDKAGYSFPVYFDINLEASMTFQAYSIPTTYFIDKKGEPIAQATGSITKDVIQQGIDMIYFE